LLGDAGLDGGVEAGSDGGGDGGEEEATSTRPRTGRMEERLVGM
jgi:hypothetical protein